MPVIVPSEPIKPKKTLREIFNSFAADAAQRFPDIKGQLLVLDINEHIAYGKKNIDTQKTGLTAQTAAEYLQAHPITQSLDADARESSCAVYDDKRHLNTIFINDRVSEAERSDVKASTEMHLLYVLDHELAHCAVKNGRTSRRDPSAYDILMGETVADAYAIIRHYQRFGTDSHFADQYVDPAARAFNFIVGEDITHFTSFALEAIINRKNDIDFDNLTPIQTVELARRFAFEHIPSQPVVEELYRSFKDVRQAFRTNWNSGVKALIEKTLDPNSDYYTFHLGDVWLKKYLEDRKFPDGTPIRLDKAYLDDASRRLKERELKFEQEQILFNTPKLPKPPRNDNPPPKLAA